MCKQEKDILEFKKRVDRIDQYTSKCLVCLSEYYKIKNKEYRKTHKRVGVSPEKTLEYHKNFILKHPDFKVKYSRKNNLMSSYGITLDEYEILLNKQGGVCAICSQKESSKNNYLCVDHDHKTGKVRGLLCTQCNHAIGKLKDDPNLFIKAAEYLADHKPTPGF